MPPISPIERRHGDEDGVVEPDAPLAEVTALLDQIPALAHPSRILEALPGGLTNRNYKVTMPTDRYVARISGHTGDLLAIDREAEYRNSVAAASAGVAPNVVDYLPGQGVLVIDWVDGHTLQDSDLRSAHNLAKIARACRRLHAGPRFVNDFDMCDIQRRYLATVLRQGFRLPNRYLQFTDSAARICQALAVNPPATVPCHNDLLAANFIAGAHQLWLIDYEYAGNNDPCFELGNIWSEANLDVGQLELLVAAYYGGPRPEMVARARLQGLMSKYGWMLWASIQAGASTLEFDFWEWGLEKYERAVAEFLDPGFDDLLDTVAGRSASGT